MRFIYFYIVSILLVGCSDSNTLPNYGDLSGLRVMAIVADTPEIQNPTAGTVNVNITPYLSDIGGSGTITLQIQSCTDPGVSSGADPVCDGAQNASSVQTVTINAPTLQPVGTFGSPERTGAPSTGAISVGLLVPANFLANYSPQLQNNGIAYLITVNATSSSGSVRSFRRIMLSNKTPNTNPVLSDLLANGSSAIALPATDVQLSFVSSTQPETYPLMGADGTIQTTTEIFQTTWFVSDGNITYPYTNPGQSTTWNVPGSEASGRKVILVGVLRDGRGGESVIIRLF